MLILVNNPLTPESRLAAASLLHNSFNDGTLTPRTGVRILCSCPSSPAAPFPRQRVAIGDVQKAPSAAKLTQRIGSRESSTRIITRAASMANPIFPEDAYIKSQNGAATSRSPKVEVSAKGKWQKKSDSSLSEDEPLPLPMTWPGSEPSSKEKIDGMLKCDPEQETCKSVIYQWTGDCKRCQGTGWVSFYRKKHEVISKCIVCHGIGSVHKITSRADIQDMDGSKGSWNGSAR